jgi:peptidoglycan/LPS O-acetylase OafA/YrhL
VWDDVRHQERYREIVAQVRAWDAELPSRTGVTVIPEALNRITPRFPTPVLWIAVGLIALVVRRPDRSRTILVLWGSAFLVLLIHAASQGVAPEFALPLYPVFIVTALAALAGDRRREEATA